jgi:hypothetical protein
LTIGLQGGQPRGAYAAKRRSPMNVSSFADTFLLLLRLWHYRVVQSSITRQSILFRAHCKVYYATL